MRVEVNRQEFHPELLSLLEQKFNVENNPQLSNAEFNLVSAQQNSQYFEICPYMNFKQDERADKIYFVIFPMTGSDSELSRLLEKFFYQDSPPRLSQFYLVQETQEILDLLLKHCAQAFPESTLRSSGGFIWSEFRKLAPDVKRERDEEIRRYLS